MDDNSIIIEEDSEQLQESVTITTIETPEKNELKQNISKMNSSKYTKTAFDDFSSNFSEEILYQYLSLFCVITFAVTVMCL